MGAFGHGPLDNDTALDWILDLEKPSYGPTADMVVTALRDGGACYDIAEMQCVLLNVGGELQYAAIHVLASLLSNKENGKYFRSIYRPKDDESLRELLDLAIETYAWIVTLPTRVAEAERTLLPENSAKIWRLGFYRENGFLDNHMRRIEAIAQDMDVIMKARRKLFLGKILDRITYSVASDHETTTNDDTKTGMHLAAHGG